MNFSGMGAAYPGMVQGQANLAQLAQAQQALDANIFELTNKKRALDASVAAINMPNGAGPTAPPASNYAAFSPQPAPFQNAQPQNNAKPETPGFKPPGMGEFGAMPQTTPQPVASPAPAPQPAADPGAGLDPSGATGGNLFQQSNDVLNKVVSEVKAGNPNADPVTLAMAVEKRLKLLNDIDPETKTAALMQVRLASAQAAYYQKLAAAQSLDDHRKALEDHQNDMADIARQNANSNTTRAGAAKTRADAAGGTDNGLDKLIDRAQQRRTSARNAFTTATSRSITPQQYQIERETLAKAIAESDAEIKALTERKAAGGAAPAKPAAAPAQPAAPAAAKPTQAEAITQAREAMKRGWTREQVTAKLKAEGYSADGL